MKRNVYKLMIIFPFLFTSACNTSQVIETGNKDVIHETKFNSAYINMQNEDFASDGFSFGDSCNIYFSNGKSIKDVPYYDGYYTRSDYPLICGYQNYPYVQITINNSSDFYDQYELDDKTTVNIKLNEKGKYLDVQNAFSMHYSNERIKFKSDEMFANFRNVKTTNIQEGVLYRGASPFNNTYNRAPYADKLLQDNHIKFILDLSDTEADMDFYIDSQTYQVEQSYAYQQEKVYLGLGSNFRGLF